MRPGDRRRAPSTGGGRSARVAGSQGLGPEPAGWGRGKNDPPLLARFLLTPAAPPARVAEAPTVPSGAGGGAGPSERLGSGGDPHATPSSLLFFLAFLRQAGRSAASAPAKRLGV